MKRTIAFFEVEKWEKSPLKKAFKEHNLVLFKEPLTEKTAEKAKKANIVSVFIYSKIDEKVLRKLPRLSFVATRSTGFDHINLEACSKRGIAVSNVPYYGENTVAEHTFALMLSLSRNVHKAYVNTLRGDFSIKGLRGFDLKGKTLGVIGAGHIGLHVIRIAKGFGMNVLAFDAYENSFLTEILGFRYVSSLEELLGGSDIITLHAPLTPKTYHLINRKNIGMIKKGALLINTARGALIETEALVKALDDGILGGVGLDVLEEEDLIKEEKQLLSRDFPKEKLANIVRDHILLHRENVVITPHIGFNSKEAIERILSTTIENIKRFMSKSPQNLVNAGSLTKKDRKKNGR